MRREEVLCLNNKIKEVLDTKIVDRDILDSYYLRAMMRELNQKELTLLTFENLADIYDVDFKLHVTADYKNTKISKTFTRDNVIWGELDGIFFELTDCEIHTANLCIREIRSYFKLINGDIILE